MHWFLDPIKNHYADFEGRASRQQYWMYILFYFILMLALSLLAEAIPEIELLSGLVALGLLLPNLAIAVRRLHDINKSGWWILIGLIPVVGFIVLLVWYVQKGDAGENQYGPSPLGVVTQPQAPDGDTPIASAPTTNDMSQPPTTSEENNEVQT